MSIKSRLIEGTTLPEGQTPDRYSGWNSWPDKLELVRVEKIDIKEDAERTLRLGQEIGAASATDRGENYRQIYAERIPAEVGYSRTAPMAMVTFGLAYPKGQGDDEDTRNIVAYWSHKDYSTNTLYIYRVEIGCKHDYNVQQRGRCYSVGKCKRCGHEWSCDSGD